MAKLREFLETLTADESYDDADLKARGTAFGLNGDQVAALVSHDCQKIRQAIKKNDGDNKDVRGMALRVVM